MSNVARLASHPEHNLREAKLERCAFFFGGSCAPCTRHGRIQRAPNRFFMPRAGATTVSLRISMVHRARAPAGTNPFFFPREKKKKRFFCPREHRCPRDLRSCLALEGEREATSRFADSSTVKQEKLAPRPTRHDASHPRAARRVATSRVNAACCRVVSASLPSCDGGTTPRTNPARGARGGVGADPVRARRSPVESKRTAQRWGVEQGGRAK